MEGKKQSGSSSFTTDLFGSKDSTTPTTGGLFGSIFAPQPRVLGRESLRSEVCVDKKQDSFRTDSNSKTAFPETFSQNREEEKQSTHNKETTPYYQEQKMQPFHLSSSIYYGGQDVYAYPQNPENTQNSSYSSYNKDGEDDSGSASRGNWWQGSLYY